MAAGTCAGHAGRSHTIATTSAPQTHHITHSYPSCCVKNDTSTGDAVRFAILPPLHMSGHVHMRGGCSDSLQPSQQRKRGRGPTWCKDISDAPQGEHTAAAGDVRQLRQRFRVAECGLGGCAVLRLCPLDHQSVTASANPCASMRQDPVSAGWVCTAHLSCVATKLPGMRTDAPFKRCMTIY